MNDHQKHLLGLLKEIDGFCRKHDITYYCAGGTVIGAARHAGFIPWDDDIDIYMTRREFRRFTEAFEKDPVPDRQIEYYERAYEHHSTVNRYHETTSTMMCHYHIIGYACAGTLIDIFILDPIPDGLEERREWLAKFYALADLESPALCYSFRLPAEYLDVYETYRRLADEQGVPETVRQIGEEIFSYDEKDCSEYCLRWGSVPLMYPVEAIGKPVYLPFEDMMIPVPQDWYRYLAVHYGCEWVEIPYVEQRREHINILREDVPYTYFYEKRDELFSQDELMKMHLERKDAHMRLSKTERPFEEWVLPLKSRLCIAEIEKNMSRAGLLDEQTGRGAEDVGDHEAPRAAVAEELYRKGELETILKLYEPYFVLQTHRSFMGERMHHGRQYRWFFPAFVELEEREMDILLKTLLRTGRMRLCEKLTGISIRGGRQTECVRRAQKIIDETNRIAGMYYRGEDEACLEAIRAFPDAEDYPKLTEYRWLAAARTGLSYDDAAAIERLNGVREDENPDDDAEAFSGSMMSVSDALWKALGDHLWQTGLKEDAAQVYRGLMEHCRNGMFYQDIVGKGIDVKAIPIERPVVYTGNEVTDIQKMLLDEIVDICEENNISYCLGRDLARRLVLTGNPGYTYRNREILMDAESAAKLIKVFSAEDHPGRKLLSWDNDESLKDFSLIYMDTDSIYCDFRRFEQWKGRGVFITIRILRRSGAPKYYRKSAYYKEFLLNLAQLESLDRGNLKTGKKEAAFSFIQKMTTEKQRQRFRRKFFEQCLKKEAAASGGYYYYTNTRGVRPKLHKVPKADWESIVTEEFGGNYYRIPLSAGGPQTAADIDTGNEAPPESVFIYRSANLSWEEAGPAIDEDGYAMIDRESYGSALRDAMKWDALVDGAWEKVLDLDRETEE